MAAVVLDYNAVEPRRRFNRSAAVTIPHANVRLRLATVRVVIPVTSISGNIVELKTTVGIRGVTGIAQIRFRVFRDGVQIFTAQEGIESAGSEQNYVVTFQTIDIGVGTGSHTYVVTAENRTAGTTANLVGPLNFSALAIRRI